MRGHEEGGSGSGGPPLVRAPVRSRTVPVSLRRVLWGAFLLVDGAVLLVTAAAYAALYLNPGIFWWAQLLAVGLPVLAGLVHVLALAALLARRWVLFGVHAVMIVLLAVRLVPFEQLRPRPDPGAHDLVLMTLNVPRHGPSAEQLTADVTALIQAERPLFIGLQETGVGRLDAPPYRPVIASYVSPAVDTMGYELAVPQDWTTHMPIIFRPDAPGELIVEDQEQTVLRGGSDDTGRSRMVRTLFRWQGRSAVHYNLHLRSFGREKPWDGNIQIFRPASWMPFLRRYRTAYRRRALEIAEIADRIDAETLPVIISGDLNATSDHWAYRRLARGRTDAFRRVGTGWGGTYHATLPLIRIDYVIAGPEWEFVDAYVPDVRLSDHRPVVARLRWRTESAGTRSR